MLKHLGKKFLSLALIFNSLVGLISAGNVLTGHYASGQSWQPYSPYLAHGSLFWLTVLTALLNIFPSKMVGKVHVRRLLFHHYVYGFLIMVGSTIFITFPVPKSLGSLFTPSFAVESMSIQSLVFYTQWFVFHGGLTLLLDDLPDVSLTVNRSLDRLRQRMYRSGRTLQFIHLSSSLITIYISAAVFLSFVGEFLCSGQWPMSFLSHIVFTVNLLINGVWGINVTKKKIWCQK